MFNWRYQYTSGGNPRRRILIHITETWAQEATEGHTITEMSAQQCTILCQAFLGHARVLITVPLSTDFAPFSKKKNTTPKLVGTGGGDMILLLE